MRALLLAAILALAAPLAAAEHVYSHRLVVEGRLVGADGLPLPGRLVEFVSEGAIFDDACADEPHRRITDEWGDFRFCWHTHDVPASARVGARSGNATALTLVDTLTRASTIALADETENGTAPPGWNATYLLGGRVWRAGATRLEGVDVYGLVVPFAPVNVTLETPDGEGSEFQVRADRFGEYTLRLQVVDGVDPARVEVVAESMGTRTREPLDAPGHRMRLDVRLPPLATGPGDPEEPASVGAPPGTRTPAATPVLVATVGLALVGAIAMARWRAGKK